MRTAPEDLPEGDLLTSLAEGWGLKVSESQHVAVGGGSYHWRVRDEAGNVHWVTVDDLDRKGYLGNTRESAFAALRRALDTAVALRGVGLNFVVAPVPGLHPMPVRAPSPLELALDYSLIGRSKDHHNHRPRADEADLSGERLSVEVICHDRHESRTVEGAAACR